MKKIIGVTKCPNGLAHTYMSAEKLETVGKQLGYQVKIETQGAAAVENELSAEDIQQADYVIIAADAAIDGKERFAGKKLLEVPIADVLKNAQGLIESLEVNVTVFQAATTTAAPASGSGSPMKQLMNGVSHMVPFVVVGGLLIAIAAAIGGENLPEGLIIPDGSIWQRVSDIGAIGFSLMLPIFAGYIAYAIAGRAALAPAMIGAQIANTPSILGTESGTGFLGAILVGYMAGHLVKWMNSWKIPKDLRAAMPTVVIPILGTGIIAAALMLVLGAPIAWLMDSLNNMLASLSGNSSTSILLGAILGTMLGLDMGGPVNKVAYLFGVASITTGNTVIMGAVAAVIGVPPLALGLSTFINKSYSEEEKSAGIPALLMGLLGITEGAIPFAAANPKVVMPSIILGSAVTGAVAMLFEVSVSIPNGGPVAGLLGATNNVLLYLLTIVIGIIVVNVLLLVFGKFFAKGAA